MAVRTSYLRVSWKLATQTMPLEAWDGFRGIAHFPDQRSPEAKLHFLSQHLLTALAEKDKSKCLIKYRDWLLHKTLLYMMEKHEYKRSDQMTFPQDIPRVVDDLHYFHRQNSKRIKLTKESAAGTIGQYKTLDQLIEKISSLRETERLAEAASNQTAVTSENRSAEVCPTARAPLSMA
jgi:hypothetical protein